MTSWSACPRWGRRTRSARRHFRQMASPDRCPLLTLLRWSFLRWLTLPSSLFLPRPRATRASTATRTRRGPWCGSAAGLRRRGEYLHLHFPPLRRRRRRRMFLRTPRRWPPPPLPARRRALRARRLGGLAGLRDSWASSASAQAAPVGVPRARQHQGAPRTARRTLRTPSPPPQQASPPPPLRARATTRRTPTSRPRWVLSTTMPRARTMSSGLPGPWVAGRSARDGRGQRRRRGRCPWLGSRRCPG